MPGQEGIPEDLILRDGRLWRDMSWAERKIAEANLPYLRKLWTKSQRDSRAALLRRCRRLRFLEERLGRLTLLDEDHLKTLV